jgi:lysine biosynthesis protein LysW
MAIAFCPECEHRLKLNARPHIGLRAICPSCKANLEVVSLRPLELDVYVPGPTTTPRGKGVAAAFCPECEHRLKLGNHPHEGQQLICPVCKTDLEVVSLSPLELDVSMTRWKKKDRKPRGQKGRGQM